MNWARAAEYLEGYSHDAAGTASNWEANIAKPNASDLDQISRKRLLADISFMLAGAIRSGLGKERP